MEIIQGTIEQYIGRVCDAFYQISIYHYISHYKKAANQDKFITYRFSFCY